MSSMDLSSPGAFAMMAAKCPCCFNPGTVHTGNITAQSKLSALRVLMAERNLDAYLILSPDAHNSEYVSSCDERRSYLSGFSGSAGTALVTRDKALLWTDARYFVQTENQLDGDLWSLMKMYEPGVPEVNDWISENLDASSRI
eukprot:9866261-Ditylum_brightwellii.AAC.1